MGSFTIGLDLGQAQDFSALAVVEQVRVLPAAVTSQDYAHALERQQAASGDPWRQQTAARKLPDLRTEWHVRHLHRWPIGTSYPTIVEHVLQILDREPLATDGLLIVDGTGVGVAVTDMFDQAYMDHRMRGCYPPIRVTITSGEKRRNWNIPKSDLFGELQVALQQKALRVAAGLPLGDILEKELLAYRMKISAAGNATFDIQRREGEGHGDLAMAVALAISIPNAMRRPAVVTTAEAS